MQAELIIILITYYIGIAIAFYVGYKIGLRQSVHISYGTPNIDKKHLEKEMRHQAEHFNTKAYDEIKPGIVYRPTAEEIEKMNEPQKVKEAKEAIAETLAQEKPPEI